MPYALEGPALAECPVSFITARSIELVQIALTIAQTKESGATVNLMDLPGCLVDAVQVVDHATQTAAAARDEAVENS